MRLLRERDSTRVRSSFRALLPALLLVAIFVVGRFLRAQFFVVFTDVSNPDEYTGALLLLNGLSWFVIYAAMVVAPLFVARELEGSTFRELGLGIDRQWMRTFAVGIGISVVGISISWWWGAFRGLRSLEFGAVRVRSPEGLLMVAAVLLVTFSYQFLGYVYEEIVFRRIMIDNFAEGLSNRGQSWQTAIGLATIVSLVAFGLIHFVYRGNFLVVIDSALTGTMFVFAYLVTGNLALPIGIHTGRKILTVFEGFSLGTVEIVGIGAITTNTLPANLEVRFVQIGVVCLLAALWVYQQRGSVGIPAAIYQRSTRQPQAD